MIGPHRLTNSRQERRLSCEFPVGIGANRRLLQLEVRIHANPEETPLDHETSRTRERPFEHPLVRKSFRVELMEIHEKTSTPGVLCRSKTRIRPCRIRAPILDDEIGELVSPITSCMRCEARMRDTANVRTVTLTVDNRKFVRSRKLRKSGTQIVIDIRLLVVHIFGGKLDRIRLNSRKLRNFLFVFVVCRHSHVLVDVRTQISTTRVGCVRTQTVPSSGASKSKTRDHVQREYAGALLPSGRRSPQPSELALG